MSKVERDPINEDSLPKLGLEPYAELIKRSARADTPIDDAKRGLMLLWLSDYFLDAIDVELAPFGITESKLDLLILLTLHGDKRATPSAIAKRLGITRASATSLIDWLEKRRLVIRNHSAQDRRKVFVSITEEGRTFVDKALPTYWSFCASILTDLEPEERQVFEKIVNKLNHSLQQKLGVER
ncbi:MarR family transcriptional regulator [Pullulanibacillus camelliae]|uniref:MarR family transcriptional regulator n=1 Tax=Pullulanibacillus camelliae TaxID=1707096 RepID=A0A8J2YC02_9BACL|nr:MarR family transcriptional regulator [Pullulanibacillus camelliae]GGE35210.1 MarR family transcriptional regulator [Pullulanibacillus camelliae]